ncbi:MAG: HAD-IA family hydrolase [Pseudomonadota bacterium]
MRNVIFDLDGTLADTSGDLIAAANRTLGDMGVASRLDPARDAGTALRGGRAMLRLGLTRDGACDEAVIDRAYPAFLEIYRDAIDHHTRLYPGAMAAVDALSRAGYPVGICTNKPEALADLLLRNLGVRDAFAGLVGADTLPVRKPDPAPLRLAATRCGGDPALSLLVGDSDTDRNTAAAAGVPCILVTFGPSGEDMAALQPEALLHRYEDLPDLVERLLG